MTRRRNTCVCPLFNTPFQSPRRLLRKLEKADEKNEQESRNARNQNRPGSTTLVKFLCNYLRGSLASPLN